MAADGRIRVLPSTAKGSSPSYAASTCPVLRVQGCLRACLHADPADVDVGRGRRRQTHAPPSAFAARVTAARRRAGRGAGMTMALDAEYRAWLNFPAPAIPDHPGPGLEPGVHDTSTPTSSRARPRPRRRERSTARARTVRNITRSLPVLGHDRPGRAVISAATANFYRLLRRLFMHPIRGHPMGPVVRHHGGHGPRRRMRTTPGRCHGTSRTRTRPSASPPPRADGWVSIDAKNFFAAAAAAGGSRAYMQLRAHDESSTSIGFKQFRSRNADNPAQVPYATVTYTSTPVIGTRSTVPTSTCATGSNAPYLSSATPTFKSVRL